MASVAGLTGELPRYGALRSAPWGFARIGSIVALAVAWEVFARSGAVTPFMLPPLSAVLARIWNDLLGGDLMLNTALRSERFLASDWAWPFAATLSPAASSTRSSRLDFRCPRLPFFPW